VDEDDERLGEYRRDLLSMHRGAWESFDRTLTALASGALGVSLLFVHDIAPKPVRAWPLIVVAWCLFALSLAVNLLSYMTSASSAEAGRGQVDEDLRKPTRERDPQRVYGSRWNPWTKRLNITSAVGLGVGVAVMLAFAVLNVSRIAGGTHG
jgi:hypothetical protein